MTKDDAVEPARTGGTRLDAEDVVAVDGARLRSASPPAVARLVCTNLAAIE